MWDRHLVHHLQNAKNEAGKEKDELKQLEKQLLKLQLGGVRQKVNDLKKKDKDKTQLKIMVVQGGLPDDRCQDLNPNIYPDDP